MEYLIVPWVFYAEWGILVYVPRYAFGLPTKILPYLVVSEVSCPIFYCSGMFIDGWLAGLPMWVSIYRYIWRIEAFRTQVYYILALLITWLAYLKQYPKQAGKGVSWQAGSYFGNIVIRINIDGLPGVPWSRTACEMVCVVVCDVWCGISWWCWIALALLVLLDNWSRSTSTDRIVVVAVVRARLHTYQSNQSTKSTKSTYYHHHLDHHLSVGLVSTDVDVVEHAGWMAAW